MVNSPAPKPDKAAPYFKLRHAYAHKQVRRDRPVESRARFAEWTLPAAAMAIFGGCSWISPVPRLIGELLAIALLVGAVASAHSRMPTLILPEDWLLMATFTLVIAQLIPLPPALWGRLPGRTLAFAIDQDVFGHARWRALSLDPPTTWRTALAMLPGLATYCAVRTGRNLRLRALVAAFVLAASVSLALGLMQLLFPDWAEIRPFGPSDTIWPVGLFANHNHQGLFLLCALPLLPLLVGTFPAPQFLFARLAPYTFGIAAFLVGIMVLATGSRTSAALLVPVLAALPFCQLKTGLDDTQGRAAALVRLAVRNAVPLLGIAAMVLLGGALALSALHRGPVSDDLRWTFWSDSWHAALAFWPVGSGLGTFVEAFAMHEQLTSLSSRYLNHAHNEYLEIMLEAGLPGLVLVSFVLLHIGKASAQSWFKPATCAVVRTHGRAASIPLLLVVLGSIVDYPARTFAISSLVGLCWAMQAVTSEAARKHRCSTRVLGRCSCEPIDSTSQPRSELPSHRGQTVT